MNLAVELSEIEKQVSALISENIEYKTQLNKSKDIIRYLCEMVRELSKPNPQPFNVEYSLKEAEQFLKETE